MRIIVVFEGLCYPWLVPRSRVLVPSFLGCPAFGAVIMFSLLESYRVYRVRSAHDEQAFAQIYDAYVQAIYRFVYVKINSKEQAEDITAEAFLRLWQALRKGEEVRHVRGMLYRIARNLIIDAYRQRGAAPDFYRVTFSEDETSSLDESLSDRGKDSRAIEARADLSLLLAQITQLKDDYQDVLTLRLLDDLSFQDIADILGKETGTVRVLFHRALKALERLQQPSDRDTPLSP